MDDLGELDGTSPILIDLVGGLEQCDDFPSQLTHVFHGGGSTTSDGRNPAPVENGGKHPIVPYCFILFHIVSTCFNHPFGGAEFLPPTEKDGFIAGKHLMDVLMDQQEICREDCSVFGGAM